MPVTFTVESDKGYFISTYFEDLSEEELLRSWDQFFASDRWQPGLKELADLNLAHAENISSYFIRQLAGFTNTFYASRGISTVKVAIYAPENLCFGLSRMYEILTDSSVEKVMVFRDRQKAEFWLMSDEQGNNE
jgi:hypothetical protein